MDNNQKMVIYTAVLKIAQDMQNRRGIGDEWQEIDYDIQEDILSTWRDIIIQELEMYEDQAMKNT